MDEDNPLTEPIDETDTWTLSVASPCFEGQCPADYDPYVNGDPLPQSFKGATFKCKLHVYATDAPPLSLIKNNIVHADTFPDEIEISVVLTGESCVGDCFSNVLFLPGLQASRLYKEKNILGAIVEDQLWEPNANSDVEALYLNVDGASKNSGIYTSDIIKETNTPVSAGFAG